MRAGVSPARHAQRLEGLAEAMGRRGISAALIGVGAELEWLVGYTARGFERLNLLIVRARGRPTLVVPRLELGAASVAPAVSGGLVEVVEWQETDDPFALVAQTAHDPGSSQRMLVSDGLRAAFLLRLQAVLPDAAFEPVSTCLAALRRAKDEEETSRLRAAAAAADRAMAGTVAGRLVGRSEADIAREVGERLVAEGHDSALFAIVASGPHSASPHHEPSDRLVAAGEPLLLDIGGRLSGYCSDTTRTFWVGGAEGRGPDPAFTALYGVLRTAQAAGRAAVRPGVTPEAVDRAARAVIEAGGHGEHFFHRLGHGIGLEVHEEPWIVSGNAEPLAVGDAFSVEPGIYLEGRYGARIEDIVVCRDGVAETLNDLPRELAVVRGT
ncbi:Xaa-Pro peptidase family protein [soil metagenome]